MPALVESAMLRQPVRLFVSPDTRRDYLFNVDAARLALAEADAGAARWAWGSADGGESASCGERRIRASRVVIVRRVDDDRPRPGRHRCPGCCVGGCPVVITESPESRVQPLVLRFRERSGIQATIPTTSFEAAIRSMAEAPRG